MSHATLDATLAAHPATAETARSTVTLRPCRRHTWGTRVTARVVDGQGHVEYVREEPQRCLHCDKPRDAVRSRKGKSSRRLGHDQERRIEKRYGPTKIGERGDPVDHLGVLFKWQSKATRGPVPHWLADPMAKMEGLYGDRIPLLILSYVRTGVAVEDFVVVRGVDWLALHGRDEACE